MAQSEIRRRAKAERSAAGPGGGAEDTGLFLRAGVLAAIREQGGVRGARDGRLRVFALPAEQHAPERISAPLVYA